MIFATVLAAMFCLQSCKKDKATGTENGHEWVDLGLTVKWATCNVGADSPEEYGDYFAWGEVLPKEEYTQANSVTYGDSTISDISGNPQYDAATANWGGAWRMPTYKEIKEMYVYCTIEWTVQNGVAGQLFTSKKTGKSIFFPAAGYIDSTELFFPASYGRYWSASTDIVSRSALHLTFDNQYADWCGRSHRNVGLTVRPVTE